MSSATVSVVANILGTAVGVQVSRSNDGAGQWTPTIAAGKTSTAWTKSSDTAGVAALDAGHGIITNDKVDVFWSGGRRYNLTATVAGNNVTVSGGSGDALPASSTEVVVCKRQIVNAAFDPDDVSVLLVSATRRGSVVFVDGSGAALLALDIPAGECCLWWANSGIPRPFAGNPVAAIWVSNGDGSTANDVMVSVMYDSTP